MRTQPANSIALDLELTNKSIADSQTGCRFKWKKNINN